MKSTNDTSLIQTYLDYCKYNKRLDEKTVKAYAIDLQHFYMAFPDQPLILLRQLKPIFPLYMHYSNHERSNEKSLL